MIKQLGHKDADLRETAAVALGRIGPVARGAVPRLTQCLADQDLLVRKAAKEALGQIERRDRP